MKGNWGLLGHEWAVDMLRQHITHAGVRHAYLFSGSPGLGRRTLALRFTQALNCPQPAAPGEPCLACRTCRQIESLQYPDLAIVQAEKEGGVLKVEQVRQVRHSLTLKPYQGKYKAALFLRFQEANPSAANALLKTLEEAPAHVLLLLTADDPESLLPTIASRCEVLRLRPVPVERLEAALRGRGADEAASRLLAHLSGGRPGAALRLLADPSALETRRVRLDEIPRLLAGSRAERFAYAESLARDKEALREVLLLWLAYWRDVMLAAGRAGTPLLNVDRAQEIQALAGRLDLPEARRRVAALEQAVERLERNVNARLLTEVVLLDWPRLVG